MNIDMFERNLPPYLAHDLKAWKKGVEARHLQFRKTCLSTRCKAMFEPFSFPDTK